MSTARKQAGVVKQQDMVMRHHRAAWRVERIGWAIIAVVLAAALFGVFGYGALSRTRAGAPDGLVVEYDRLQRSSAPTDYRIEVAPSLVREGVVRLRVDRALLNEVQPDSILPEPRTTRVEPALVEYEFDAVPGDTPVRIDMRFRPATFGRVRGSIAAEGAPPVAIDQFVYP